MTGSRDADKVRRAAADPDRPGAKCKADPGRYKPVIDATRCEVKRDCVDVCPYDVFEVRRIEPDDFAALSILGKLRNIVHGRRLAYTPNASDCRACGLCVVACREGAIRLVEVV